MIATDLHDPNAERAVIGAILLYPAEVHGIDLAAGDFFKPDCRHAYEAIQTLVHDRGEPVDILTVSDEVTRQGRAEPSLVTLGDMAASVATAANVGFYVAIVRRYAIKRRLIEAARSVLQQAETCAPDEVVATAERMQREVSHAADERMSVEHVVSAMEAIAGSFAAEPTGPSPIVRTGLDLLDSRIGGLPTSALTLIAGRPSQGKSSLARIIADHVAVGGDPVGYLTLEEDHRQWAMNLCLRRALVDTEKIMKGTTSAAERVRMNAARVDLSRLPLYWSDDRPMTGEKACARLRQMHARHGIRVGIVDYWNRLSLPGRRSTREEAGVVVSLFSSLATELGIALVVVAQLNRDSEKEQRKPRLSDLKESGGWEEAATLVILCHREGFYKDTEPQDEMDLIVAKSKTTRVGRFRAAWCGKYLWVGDKMPSEPGAEQRDLGFDRRTGEREDYS